MREDDLRWIKINQNKLLPDFNVIYFDEIDSTNNYAKNLIRSDALLPDNTLVIADCQTAGRGRTGHKFVSPHDTGIYLTLILNLNLNKNFQLVTIAAAAAVCIALEKFIDLNKKLPLIKWVNDIFICNKLNKSSKKVCGILAEAVTGNDNKLNKIIAGIGVNIWPYKFAAELSQAGSVFDELNDNVTRAEIAAEIVKNLAGFALKLDDYKIIENYRARMIFNTPFHSGDISYLCDNKECCGHVIDIAQDGGLVVKDNNNNLITLRSGEVFEIRELI